MSFLTRQNYLAAVALSIALRQEKALTLVKALLAKGADDTLLFND